MAKRTTQNSPFVYVMLGFFLFLPLLKIESVLDEALFPRFALVGVFCLGAAFFAFKKLAATTWPLTFSLALGGFLIMQVISSSAAVNISESYASLARYFLMAVYFFMVLALVRQKTISVFWLLKCFTAGAALISIITATQLLQALGTGNFFSNIYSIKGTFTHKNLLSSALLLSLPFTLAAWATLKKPWRNIALITALLCVLEIFVLRTRGVWLGVFGSAIATALLFLATRKKEEKLPLAWVGAFSGIALLVLVGFFASSNIKAGITNSSNVQKRLTFWSNSVDMIGEHPALGVGAGNWKLIFPKYGLSQVDDSTMQGITHIQRPHNDYLWVWAESGPLGLLFFLALFVLPLFQITKNLNHTEDKGLRTVNYFAFMTIIAYAIFSFSDFPLERAPHTVYFFTAIAMVYGSTSKSVKEFKAPWLKFGLIAASGLALYVVSQRWQGEKNTVAVLEANRQQNAAAIVPAAEKARSTFYTVDPYANPIYYYSALGYQFSNRPKEALNSAQWAKEDAPYNILVLNSLANINARLGNKTVAYAYLDSALAIAPKYKAALVLKANLLLEEKRYTDALDVLNFHPLKSNDERYLQALATALRGTLQSYPQHGRFKPLMDYLQKQPPLKKPMDYISAYRTELSRRRVPQN